MKKHFYSFLFFCFIAVQTLAQQSILVIESSTKKIIQLSAVDGSVLNSNFIDFSASQTSGTPKGIAQVGDKLWITNQTMDDIFIYDFNGNLLNTITGGLDNMRGLNVVNNEVWVTNAGSNNGATANSIARYTTTGTFIGYYPSITSPFDVLDSKTNFAYVVAFNTSGIQKMGYDGTDLGNFVPAGTFQNAQQINFNSSGDLILAVFQTNSTSGNLAGVYILSQANGSILNFWPVTSGLLRGTIQTTNGNYLYSTGDGVFSIEPVSGTVTQITTGSFQYFTKVDPTNLSTSETSTSSFSIFPNPVENILQIKSLENFILVEVYDTSGRLVLKKKMRSNEVDVSSLEKGNYFVKLSTKEKSISTRIIKK